MEISLILGLSVIVAVAFNHFSPAGIPLGRKITPPPVENPLPALQEAASDFPEADAVLVRQLAENGQALILDARQPDLFHAGHIPGAKNLPPDKFASFWRGVLGRVALQKMIIIYCSGGSCHDSLTLAQMVSRSGFSSIMIYRGGLADWLEKGFGLEK